MHFNHELSECFNLAGWDGTHEHGRKQKWKRGEEDEKENKT